MEKRVIGVILTVLGAIGIVMAGYNFIIGSSSTHNIKEVAIYGIIGLIFFLAGVGLVRNTRDK